MKSYPIIACLVFSLISTTAVRAITFDWAHVGNPGNAGELSGSGAGGFGVDAIVGGVAYSYSISKTEVSNIQYTEFLNSVATSDPYSLYNTSMGSSTRGGIVRSGLSGSYSYATKSDAISEGPHGTNYTYGNKPVVYVSWYDSIRFINWLHNGQGDGNTETGAYTLLGGTATPSNSLSIIRNSNATHWLPSEDEWYKSAYHDASVGIADKYFDYATGADVEPTSDLPSPFRSNAANHFGHSFPFVLGYTNGTTVYPLTDVGGYGFTASPYGTFDQSGNVGEWNEALIQSSLRGLRGGSWRDSTNIMAASGRHRGNPTNEVSTVGFRVATIPEPNTLLMLFSFTSILLWQRS